MKSYERISCRGDMVLQKLVQLEKKYYGLAVISIVPPTDRATGGYHIFFSYEDLRTDRCEYGEEHQDQDQ